MKLTNVRGVYAIENAVNGKRYIGSATNLAARRAWHMNALRKNKHHSAHLQRAFNEYGEGSFAFRVLVVCEKKDQIFYEQRMIDGFKSYDVSHGYNMARNAEAPYGTCTPESAKKTSAALRTRAKKYDFRGENLCIAEVAEKTGMPFELLRSRVSDHKWDIEKAVSYPRKKPKRKVDRKNQPPKLRNDGTLRRSRLALFEYDGKSMNVADWARHIGCDYSSLSNRVKAGWDFDKAITTPFEDNRKLITFNGKTQNIHHWAKEMGLQQQTLSHRLNKLGWSVERALTAKPAYYHHEVVS